MKRTILFISSALLAVSVLSTRASATGPWVQPEDRAQVAITASYTFADSYYNSNELKKNLPGDISNYEVHYMFTAGLTQTTDISITVGYVDSNAENQTPPITKRSISGISDSSIRVKSQLKTGHTSVALLTGLRIPGGYDKDYFNSPGRRSVDYELGLSFGEYYRERTLYWTTDAVTRLRMGAPPNELEVNFELGRVFDHVWLLRGIADYRKSLSGGTIEESPLGSGIISFCQVEEEVYDYGIGVTHLNGDGSSLGVTVKKNYGTNSIRADESFYLTYTYHTKNILKGVF